MSGITADRIPQKERDRFWSKVDRRGADECWPWSGAIGSGGYGNFWIGESVYANSHVVSFVLAKGPIEDGNNVRHTCDNRPCCNPSHLWQGTVLENLQDMNSKGRRPKGDSSAQTLIRSSLYSTILSEIESGNTLNTIAAKYGVGRSTIHRVKARNEALLKGSENENQCQQN